jgi:hypothetical protein
MTLIYSKTPVYSSVKRPNISMMMTTSSYNVSSSLNTNKIVNSYNISSKMGMDITNNPKKGCGFCGG